LEVAKWRYLAFFKQAITSGGSSLEVELVDIAIIWRRWKKIKNRDGGLRLRVVETP
jgi:hypothetical protein